MSVCLKGEGEGLEPNERRSFEKNISIVVDGPYNVTANLFCIAFSRTVSPFSSLCALSFHWYYVQIHLRKKFKQNGQILQAQLFENENYKSKVAAKIQ